MIFDGGEVVSGIDLPTFVAWVKAAGVVGLLLIGLWAIVSERVVAGRQYRRALAERDAALREVSRLNELIASDVVPPLIRATDTQQQLVPLVQEALALMRAKP